MAICPLFPGRIGVWKCWFLWREEKRRTRRKTLEARTRTNNNLNPDMASTSGIEPGHIDGRRVLSPLRHPCSPGCTENRRVYVSGRGHSGKELCTKCKCFKQLKYLINTSLVLVFSFIATQSVAMKLLTRTSEA